jgi:hypothetical protein
MNSSPKMPERTSDPLLAGGGGLPAAECASDDPYADLLALMEAVEVLCPRWPARPARR